MITLSGTAVQLSPSRHWKHPYWDGGRSYAYFDEAGTIAAHAAVWPFILRMHNKTLGGVHPIEWGASGRIRGSGGGFGDWQLPDSP